MNMDMDIVDQLKLMRAGKTTPFPRSVTLREAWETIERLRAYIQALDGKTIAIRGENNTFIDDGIIVATDVLEVM